MIGLLVTMLIACLCAGLIYWIASLMPFPQPFKNIALAICLGILLLWILAVATGNAPGIVLR